MPKVEWHTQKGTNEILQHNIDSMKKFYAVIILLTVVLIATFEAVQAVPAWPRRTENTCKNQNSKQADLQARTFHFQNCTLTFKTHAQ